MDFFYRWCWDIQIRKKLYFVCFYDKIKFKPLSVFFRYRKRDKGDTYMRRISTKNCIAGMVLAKPVYNDIGLALIGIDIELTDSLIYRLLQLGVDSVYIHDSRTDDIIIEDPISDETREMALKAIKHTFKDMFSGQLTSRSLIKNDLASVFKPVLENMIKDLKSNHQAMLMLSTIYIKDLYLYTHSLQVGLYTISVGMAKGYNQQQILELGLGSLLHDIGKTEVPISILEKEGPLTKEEYDLIKEHTTHGFNMLRKEHGIPLLSAHCAYQHHERLDGSGYPRGIKGEDIHAYAKIVAIADVYDALISKRVYKEPILPHEALEYLYTKANTEFDKEILEIFRKTVAIYPIGVNLTLSSGESGIVVDINSNLPDRPIMRVLEKENKSLSETYEIDLSKELSKMIVKCSL